MKTAEDLKKVAFKELKREFGKSLGTIEKGTVEKKMYPFKSIGNGREYYDFVFPVHVEKSKAMKPFLEEGYFGFELYTDELEGILNKEWAAIRVHFWFTHVNGGSNGWEYFLNIEE